MLHAGEPRTFSHRAVADDGLPPWGRIAERGHYRPNPPRLLDRVRQALRVRHYSPSTERACVNWIRRFILFHDKRHPDGMAEPEINAFLTHLAVRGKVSASTQNQALNAFLFLHRHVLKRRIDDLGDIVRARKPRRLPVVMTREEIKCQGRRTLSGFQRNGMSAFCRLK